VIAAWWAQWPTANVGIACGIKHNLVVLDLEGPDRVPQAFSFMSDLIAGNAPMPKAPVAITRAGGRHLYLSAAGAPPDFHKKLWPRLGGPRWVDPSNPRLSMGDIQTDGKHVVAPPSVINGAHYEQQDGVPGGISGAYVWERPLLGAHLPPAPKWFWKLLEKTPTPKRPIGAGALKYPGKLQYLVDEVAKNGPGSHNRNAATYWAANRAVEEVVEGHYSAAEAIAALTAVAQSIGLGDDDPQEIQLVLRHLHKLGVAP
jgi:hypothetical protein